MVANLSAHKPGWDDQWEEFSEWAEKGKQYQTALLNCVDEDTNAFNEIMAAIGLPKKSDQEKAEFKKAMNNATRNAINVPLKVMQLAHDSMEIMQVMAEIGNPNCISDAGVGALCTRTAIEGAYLNVKINAAGFDDKLFLDEVLGKAESLVSSSKEKEAAILNIVNKKIGE
jgi:glutamate formiminotransferase/formiminotetrahydrofolate cyclodeaminase